jgi:GTP cyclohydrolase I
VSDKQCLTWSDVDVRAARIAEAICADPDFAFEVELPVYPVPRGGIPAALALRSGMFSRKNPMTVVIVDSPEHALVVVDDIVDSGATRQRFLENYEVKFYALVDRQEEKLSGWVSFPWERLTNECGPQENIRRVIEYIGDDPNREGLLETPDRVVRSYDGLFGGYKQDPADVIKVFNDDTCDEMVVVRDVEFYSTCEHHMLPFFGRAHIAYIPSGRVIGVSKLVRILEVFCRRLQIQERLCQQVTSALNEYLKPKGAACVIEAQHFCMTARGVQKQHSMMVTSSLTGVFKDGATRHEFLHMIGKG